MEARTVTAAAVLVRHRYGMLEPGEDCPLLPPQELALVLVPALCYDRQGFRLGFGGGYYDRWLEGYSGVRIGLCRERVLQDRLPTEPHDQRVDWVVTERGCLSASGEGKSGA